MATRSVRGERGRRYEESRLDVGDTVTVVGTALPFGHLDDPDGADHLDRYGDPLAALDDPEVAMNIAEAREAGILDDARGGVGQRRDPGLRHRPARPATGARPGGDGARARPRPRRPSASSASFDLEPDLLVLAAGRDTPLLVAHGAPGEVVAREEGRFLLGLLGAILAIAGAIGAAVLLAAG